jgi:hypothetical protein
LAVVGAHTPWFPFEHDVANVRQAANDIDILRQAVVDPPTAALVIAAFAVLYRFHRELTELCVVLGCGAIAALLQPSGVS